MMMEATHFFGTLVFAYQATRGHVSGDSNFKIESNSVITE